VTAGIITATGSACKPFLKFPLTFQTLASTYKGTLVFLYKSTLVLKLCDIFYWPKREAMEEDPEIITGSVPS
jgi:hypothetical protein